MTEDIFVAILRMKGHNVDMGLVDRVVQLFRHVVPRTQVAEYFKNKTIGAICKASTVYHYGVDLDEDWKLENVKVVRMFLMSYMLYCRAFFPFPEPFGNMDNNYFSTARFYYWESFLDKPWSQLRRDDVWLCFCEIKETLMGENHLSLDQMGELLYSCWQEPPFIQGFHVRRFLDASDECGNGLLRGFRECVIAGIKNLVGSDWKMVYPVSKYHIHYLETNLNVLASLVKERTSTQRELYSGVPHSELIEWSSRLSYLFTSEDLFPSSHWDCLIEKIVTRLFKGWNAVISSRHEGMIRVEL